MTHIFIVSIKDKRMGLYHATASYVSKRKNFVEHDKKKPPDVKSNKNGKTERICLVLLHAKSAITKNVKLTTLPHVKSDVKWIECVKTLPHTKSDIKTATMMKNSATASSSSPCPSSPEAMIPKNISHGH
jgi:hypothetical protein